MRARRRQRAGQAKWREEVGLQAYHDQRLFTIVMEIWRHGSLHPSFDANRHLYRESLLAVMPQHNKHSTAHTAHTTHMQHTHDMNNASPSSKHNYINAYSIGYLYINLHAPVLPRALLATSSPPAS